MPHSSAVRGDGDLRWRGIDWPACAFTGVGEGAARTSQDMESRIASESGKEENIGGKLVPRYESKQDNIAR